MRAPAAAADGEGRDDLRSSAQGAATEIVEASTWRSWLRSSLSAAIAHAKARTPNRVPKSRPPTASRDGMSMASQSELVDDAIAEILLRLPPADPAYLIRASLVWPKPWRRVLSDPAFPRRYRAFHRTPPLLGFLRSFHASKAGGSDLFVPIATPTRIPIPFLQPPFRCQPLDCHHGRVLLDTVWGTEGNLTVWDPITGDHTELPEPDGWLYSTPAPARFSARRPAATSVTATAAPSSCTDTVARAWIYSSKMATWSPPAAFGEHSFMERKRGAIIGDGFYFLLNMGTAILKFDLGKHCLSVIGSPLVYSKSIVLMPMEDGSLGLAGLEDLALHLWSMKVNPKGVATWVQCRIIVLEQLFPTYNTNYGANVISFAEGACVLLLHADVRAFMFDLKSGRLTKLSKLGHYYDAFRFTSFYIPCPYIGGTLFIYI
uniref:F-box protein AT5G49610-like beta-propeller domain-containing protein n=1 Tax=Setaria viridis TaxID=4556 RepID=A0A4U6VN88_SETVI|nr:LOW QUALITY PROTEIN: hypothetical protein SEVIR_2G028600v2 [Setaria viridis]